MRRLAVRMVLAGILLGGVLVLAAGGLTAPALASNGTSHAEIVDIYPNPVPSGDSGEFVTIEFPADAVREDYRLADEHTTVPLAPGPWAETGTNASDAGLHGTNSSSAVGGRTVTFSTDVGATTRLTDRIVAPLSGRLRLANGGDVVRLQRNDTVVDSVQYDSAAEGEVLHATTRQWEPLGATNRPIITGNASTVEAFVLPDASDRAVKLLAGAKNRVLLAGYTFASERVVTELEAAIARGVSVEVLVDGSPIGGMTATSATLLDRVDRAGADVRLIAGERARYRHHHAKYAVVDREALVTTENWSPAGTGGRSSRGWGVITSDESIVEGLATTFVQDTEWVDAIPWDDYAPTLVEQDVATGNYPTEFEPANISVNHSRLLVTPDNAAGEIQSLIDGATESLDVYQVSIGGRNMPFVQALISAAERGVEVRILLSSAWYSEDENEQVATWLNDLATAHDLPLSVRLATPGNAYEKIHSKGLIIDRDTAVVTSINWNNNSIRNNREVALVLSSDSVGTYYGSVFDADWERDGGGWTIPLGIALAVLAAFILAILAARTISFDDQRRNH